MWAAEREVGGGADLAVAAIAPLRWRAERAASSGNLEVAEGLYWDLFARGAVELPALLDFLDVREALAAGMVKAGRPGAVLRSSVSDSDVEALLGRSGLADGVEWCQGRQFGTLRG